MAVILCIDDSDVGLFVRKLVLEKQGHTVLTATCTAEGLALFTHQLVDLVISDHCLKGETGAQIAGDMKRLKPEVPFILLSGNLEPPEDLRDVDLFMTKALNPEVFLETISGVLKKPTRASDTVLKGDTVFEE